MAAGLCAVSAATRHDSTSPTMTNLNTASTVTPSGGLYSHHAGSYLHRSTRSDYAVDPISYQLDEFFSLILLYNSIRITSRHVAKLQYLVHFRYLQFGIPTSYQNNLAQRLIKHFHFSTSNI